MTGHHAARFFVLVAVDIGTNMNILCSKDEIGPEPPLLNEKKLLQSAIDKLCRSRSGTMSDISPNQQEQLVLGVLEAKLRG